MENSTDLGKNSKTQIVNWKAPHQATCPWCGDWLDADQSIQISNNMHVQYYSGPCGHALIVQQYVHWDTSDNVLRLVSEVTN